MFNQRIELRLKAQKKAGLYRSPPVIEKRLGRHVIINNRKLLSFASNDYLGLGSSDRLAGLVASHFNRLGPSSSASRLVSSNYQATNRAEAEFADYFGYEDALFFTSGYQANLAVLSTLFENGDTVIFDKHVHASCVKGMTASRAVLKGYRHSSMAHLEKRLAAASDGCRTNDFQAGIITESLFSMDGDLLDVKALGKLKTRHNVLTIVDEAHAFGALGPGGRGIAGDVADIALGTFGKALGLFGAFVLMPSDIKEYLFNFASPLIYTTTLPEAHSASALEVLELIKSCRRERDYLKEISRLMKDNLKEKGFSVSGDAHIISVLIGNEEKASAVSARLLELDILAFPARYPTVPSGKAILRIGMTARHTKEDVNNFCKKLTRAVVELEGIHQHKENESTK